MICGTITGEKTTLLKSISIFNNRGGCEVQTISKITYWETEKKWEQKLQG